MDFNVLIHLPRKNAFLVRNRLNAMRIPYADVKG